MSGSCTQTRLQAGVWLPAAADELQRLREDFVGTQLDTAPQHVAELLECPSVIVRQYAEVLASETTIVASDANATPSTVNECVASNDSGSLVDEVQQVYWSPSPEYDFTRRELRGLLQVANPDPEEEPSTVNERVISNNFASLTEELHQRYHTPSFQDDYPQYEFPGILRVANPEQEATTFDAHLGHEEEYGEPNDYHNQAEEDDEYRDHLYKLRASAFQLSLSQSRHAQPARINHRRITKTVRFQLGRVMVNRTRDS
jgi:hypothetical protein